MHFMYELSPITLPWNSSSLQDVVPDRLDHCNDALDDSSLTFSSFCQKHRKVPWVLGPCERPWFCHGVNFCPRFKNRLLCPILHACNMPAAGPLATAARPPSWQCPLIAAVRCSHLPAMHRCLLAVTRETNQNYFFSRINQNKRLGFLNTWFSSPILLSLLKTKFLSFPHFFALFLSGFRNPSKCFSDYLHLIWR